MELQIPYKYLAHYEYYFREHSKYLVNAIMFVALILSLFVHVVLATMLLNKWKLSGDVSGIDTVHIELVQNSTFESNDSKAHRENNKLVKTDPIPPKKVKAQANKNNISKVEREKTVNNVKNKEQKSSEDLVKTTSPSKTSVSELNAFAKRNFVQPAAVAPLPADYKKVATISNSVSGYNTKNRDVENSSAGKFSQEATPIGSNPKPVYPYSARRRGLEGQLLLSVEVLPNGLSGEINIQQSSGYRILDQAAIKAVKDWRFRSASVDGVEVLSKIDIPIQFVLND